MTPQSELDELKRLLAEAKKRTPGSVTATFNYGMLMHDLCPSLIDDIETLTRQRDELAREMAAYVACYNNRDTIHDDRWAEVHYEAFTRLETTLAKIKEELRGNECQGIEIEPGVFSGCDQSAGDCPTCGR